MIIDTRIPSPIELKLSRVPRVFLLNAMSAPDAASARSFTIRAQESKGIKFSKRITCEKDSTAECKLVISHAGGGSLAVMGFQVILTNLEAVGGLEPKLSFALSLCGVLVR
jgi:azurin